MVVDSQGLDPPTEKWLQAAREAADTDGIRENAYAASPSQVPPEALGPCPDCRSNPWLDRVSVLRMVYGRK